ncbi:unnamed protein product [Gadus morhua 'NCC']
MCMYVCLGVCERQRVGMGGCTDRPPHYITWQEICSREREGEGERGRKAEGARGRDRWRSINKDPCVHHTYDSALKALHIKSALFLSLTFSLAHQLTQPTSCHITHKGDRRSQTE